MTVMMPLMFTFLSMSFPSGLALYWVASNIISFVMQYFISGWGGLEPLKDRLVLRISQLFKGQGSFRDRLSLAGRTQVLPSAPQAPDESGQATGEIAAGDSGHEDAAGAAAARKDKAKPRSRKGKKGKHK